MEVPVDDATDLSPSPFCKSQDPSVDAEMFDTSPPRIIIEPVRHWSSFRLRTG